ncbi:flagellar assembly peptidoglycan hydrolase FlgJ [Pigmentiphaga litoralis]|uniref:flagellar assembly peptidoglycan hydrolase FlgJ n=1 Tax=Pigmentiphaga litoralis TaxID=516702 RepID=UPI003B42C4D4
MAKLDAGTSAGMAIDARSLDALKVQSRTDPKASARTAARQFEAHFAQTLLSQMRQTSFAGEGGIAEAFNSPATQNWRGMLDQQMAQTLSGVPTKRPDGSVSAAPEHSGLGLADVIEKQMTRSTVSADSVARANLPLSMSTLSMARSRASLQGPGQQVDPGAALNLNGARRIQNGSFSSAAGSNGVGGGTEAGTTAGAAMADTIRRYTGQTQNRIGGAGSAGAAGETGAAPAAATVAGSPEDVRSAFLAKYMPAARRAEEATGIPAVYILGQAALESGWGKHEIRSADGQRSHNLFGVKATGWSGRVAETRTTEYTGGKAERVSAKFRAYNSYEDAFEDYARMLSTNPRYANALKGSRSAEQFAQGLQRAGYATDPRYAEKLSSTIRRAMKVVV